MEGARACTTAACGYASRGKAGGEIHVFARAWAVNRRMDLAGEGPVGHRVLPREGVLATGFPRSAHLATLLPRNRIHRLHPVSGRWWCASLLGCRSKAGRVADTRSGGNRG